MPRGRPRNHPVDPPSRERGRYRFDAIKRAKVTAQVADLFATLPAGKLESLSNDMVMACEFYAAGYVPLPKYGRDNHVPEKVLLRDVADALNGIGLPAALWEAEGGSESQSAALARKLIQIVSGRRIPSSLRRAISSARHITISR
jgi:hypothetical protein